MAGDLKKLFAFFVFAMIAYYNMFVKLLYTFDFYISIWNVFWCRALVMEWTVRSLFLLSLPAGNFLFSVVHTLYLLCARIRFISVDMLWYDRIPLCDTVLA